MALCVYFIKAHLYMVRETFFFGLTFSVTRSLRILSRLLFMAVHQPVGATH